MHATPSSASLVPTCPVASAQDGPAGSVLYEHTSATGPESSHQLGPVIVALHAAEHSVDVCQHMLLTLVVVRVKHSGRRARCTGPMAKALTIGMHL